MFTKYFAGFQLFPLFSIFQLFMSINNLLDKKKNCFFLQPTDSPIGPRQFAGIVGSEKVSIATLEVAQRVGLRVAELLLNTEAKEILANAKAETAAAVIAEKQRKDAEKMKSEAEKVQANGHS